MNESWKWKFALLGGDRREAELYIREALNRGYELLHFASMDDLGYVGRFREFNAAIVHEDFQPLSGFELAEYLEKLFQSLPMILLSDRHSEDEAMEELPSSVIACLPAGHDPEEVLGRAEAAAVLHARYEPALVEAKRRLLP